jgi:spermidine synthase
VRDGVRFPFEPPDLAVLVRREGPAGEWVLRRRDLGGAGPRYELVLNGKLLMDSADGSSEAALAEVALRACAGGAGLRVLVGGLGFGYTLAAALRDPRVALAEVVELEPALPAFLSAPEVREVLPGAVLRDPRVRLVAGDVGERIRAGGGWDAVLLDVDNGPESLSAAGNAALYGEEALAACRRALRPGGVLAIWSSEPSPACLARLRAVFGSAEERLVPVTRDGRRLEYRILLARRAEPDEASPPRALA